MSKFLILDFNIHLTFACLPVGRDFEIWNSTFQVLLLFSPHPGRKEVIRICQAQRF
jgi:hypothetical protein